MQLSKFIFAEYVENITSKKYIKPSTHGLKSVNAAACYGYGHRICWWKLHLSIEYVLCSPYE